MSNKDDKVGSVQGYTEDDKKKAAYALNMCTVSVAQIIDYNDAYVLEQEYEAILNNLNLEQIPGDEAFLNILVELLNTITFFRIQEKKKNMLDKQYQKRMKNAIWSAVPNIGLIVAGGNPTTMLFSLATQIGSGYMNYRKEKDNIISEKEKEELELEIAAIEQFNAIRRELFTTSWRIAKEYKFPDEYRLTEKQIKQYNQILMDEDDERKFIRLEAIRENFVAYPPYWYHMGHAAAYLAGINKYRIAQSSLDEASRYKFSDDEEFYLKKAKDYFEEYYKMNKYNILREDQLTASFALEYIDVLMLEENKDTEKIKDLLNTARKMSGCAYDVIQLCAISYLQIGELSEAAILLKQLINEEYNVATNAKLLSRIYVSQYLKSEKPQYKCGKEMLTYDVKKEYKLLTNRVNELYLFEMPESVEADVEKQDERLQAEYIAKQKNLLIAAYRKAISELEHKLSIEYNRILFPGTPYNDKYFESTDEAKERRRKDIETVFKSIDKAEYIAELRNIGFRFRISDCLNRTINLFNALSIFRKSPKKDALVRLVRKKIINVVPVLNNAQEKIEKGTFDINDFIELQNNVSYNSLTSEFFDMLRKTLLEEMEQENSLSNIEEAEGDLLNLCERESLPKPEIERRNIQHKEYSDTIYFEYEIFGKDSKTEKEQLAKRAKMKEVVEKAKSNIVGLNENKVKFITTKDSDFDSYFNNSDFDGGAYKFNTVAVLDDRTYVNDDILFTIDGIVVVSQNEIRGTFKYDDVLYENGTHGSEKIIIADTYELSDGGMFNKLKIDIKALKNLIDTLGKI